MKRPDSVGQEIWDRQDPQGKLFVCIHELLHEYYAEVYAARQQQRHQFNLAVDYVINEILRTTGRHLK